MKEHMNRLLVFLLSIGGIIAMLYGEYHKEGVAEKSSITFQIQGEDIHTWEKDNVQYLFLPSNVSWEEVLLAPFGKEFYLIESGRAIRAGESIRELEQGVKMECRFIESGETFYLSVLQSEGIGALFITTQSGSLAELKADKEYVVSGSINSLNELGEWEGRSPLKEIGGRGNTSFSLYEKKPFSLTFQTPLSLQGLPQGKRYALLSNASDPSLIRNDIVRRMEAALQIQNAHTGKFLDLYINGEYEGNYYLCASLEIGSERIAIHDVEAVMDLLYQDNYEAEELYETDTAKGRKLAFNPADISGGYLLEREYSQRFFYEYEEITSAFITDEKEHFVVKSPDYCSVEQIEYIRSYVNEAEAAIMSAEGRNPETQKNYGEYIDVASFVKKYLAEEVSKNYDAGVSSSFFYKDSDVNGGRLTAGPGWDYDMSLGNYVEWMEEFGAEPTGISKLAFHTYASPWYTKLYEKEEFYQQVKKEYAEYVKPFLEQLIEEGIDEYDERLGASAAMNEIRWQEELEKNPYYQTRKETFEELKWFIAERKAFLDEEWK